MGPTILIIDNFDSFTYNLVSYFTQLGAECIVKRNNVQLSDIEVLNFDSIVLSPGPGRPAQAGICGALLLRFHEVKPILGICLGHQAIGEFFGATLKKAIKPMHGKLSEVEVTQHFIFEGMPNKFNVVRYHSLLIEDLPQCLKSLSETNEGEIMAIAHHILPIVGIQYHPEAYLTEHGLRLIQNWIDISLAAKNKM